MNVQSQQKGESSRPTAAILLAAGKSTRMNSDVPKVLHEICGRPMLAYALDACRESGADQICVVVGFGKQAVIDAFGKTPGVRFVEQTEQKGTGHAVSVCADALKNFNGDVIVLAGDMPLVRAETLRELVNGHRASGAAASIATTKLDDATGYGRIVRDAKGQFERIVEHRDCSPEQLSIHEVNPSYYCFDAAPLFAALPDVKANNAKGEYYITDVLAILRKQGKQVRAATHVDAEDAMGINSRADLAEITHLMQRRIARRWMDAGVTIVDPENTWIDSRARIGRETIIRPFTFIEGNARIGAGCRIGPFSYVADGAVVDNGASMGPGLLTAFDATAGGAVQNGMTDKKGSHVVRRPPAQASCP